VNPDVIAAALLGASAGITGGAVWTYALYRGAYKRGLFDGQLADEQATEWPEFVPDPEFIAALNRAHYQRQYAHHPAPDPPPSVFMAEEDARQGNEFLDRLGHDLGQILGEMEAERIDLHGETDTVIASWEPPETPETPENPPPHIGNPF
jgi:hypothetical protein